MADATPEQRNKLTEIFEAVRSDWPALCTNAKMAFDKERDWAIAACMKSDYAAGLAINRWQDAQKALRDCASIGVTLDPAQKLAYLLPRDGRMVYDLSYMGLIDIAIQAGTIKWAQARRVYSGEVYEPTGYDAPPIHRRKPFAKPEERGDVVGCYVVVKTADGDYLTDEMNIEEIHAIRAGSQSYKEHLASNGSKKTPWVGPGEGEMEKKTVVKRAAKYWPHSERLAVAIHHLNTDGGQGMDLTTEDETKTRVKIWTEKVNATKTGEEVAAVWKLARAELKDADMPAYEQVRAAVAARNRELGVAPPPPPAANGASTAPAAGSTPPPAQPEPGSGAPAARGRAPTPAAAPSPAAVILADMDKAEDYETLNAIAERIDAQPADLQAELNDAFNLRLEVLKKKFGHA